MIDLDDFKINTQERPGGQKKCPQCYNIFKYTILRISRSDFFFCHANGKDFFLFNNEKVKFDAEDIEKNQQLKKQRYLDLEKEINDDNISLLNGSRCPICSYHFEYYKNDRITESRIIWIEDGICYQMKEKKAYKLIVKTEN